MPPNPIIYDSPGDSQSLLRPKQGRKMKRWGHLVAEQNAIPKVEARRQFTLGSCGSSNAEPRSRKQCKLCEVSFDRHLIPLDPRAGNVGYVQEPVIDLVGRLENRVRPILPFQPMRGFRDAHHVSRDFGVEVR
jgi:hypothetical protein